MVTGSPPGKKTAQLFRFSGVVTGILLLIWLTREDINLAWVLGLAFLIASLITAAIAARLISKNHLSNWILLLLGALGGFLVGILGILLMAIKTGLHGHGVPDFTAAQIQVVLASIPVWVFLGMLVGGSAVWLRRKG